MSQIKSNKVTGRTPTGTLTIGEPGSTVQFDPDATVLLNDYATKEYVDLRTPDLGDVNLDNYYNKNEIDAIVEEASNDYLQLTGGRMSGPIAVEEGNTITMNVGDPDPGVEIHDTFIVGLSGDVTRNDQAINKAYLDFKLSEAGQGDALEYRLETASNKLKLLDNNNVSSDVSMVAGTGMSITSGSGSLTFDCTLEVPEGLGLDNEQSWTYGQYNEQSANATKNGDGISTRYTWDAQKYPVMSLSDNTTPTYVASPQVPTVNGMFISITWVSYGSGQIWAFSDAFDSKLGPPEDLGENVTRVFHSRFGKWCDVA